jgi:hypothetical protein
MVRYPRRNVFFVALLAGLRLSGFVEGRNLRVGGRFSTRNEDAAEVANALAVAGVDVILTRSYHRTRAAQRKVQGSRTMPKM